MKEKVFQFVLAIVLGLFVLLVFLPPVGTRPAWVARQLKSQTQVRSLVQGALVFASDNKDLFPASENWPDELISAGIIDPALLLSGVEDGDGVSFIYLPFPKRWSGDNLENRIVIYEDPKHFKEGVVVGFADTRTEFVPHAEFERMLAEQQASQAIEP